VKVALPCTGGCFFKPNNILPLQTGRSLGGAFEDTDSQKCGWIVDDFSFVFCRNVTTTTTTVT
jgi:hypothetical protein